MPPNIDIYGLTRRRDRATIDRFLERYVDLEACLARVDEHDVVAWEQARAQGQDFEWWSALPIAYGIQHGLTDQRASFRMDLVSKCPEIMSVYLCFNHDGQLLLGLSIDDAASQPENEAYAGKLLEELAHQHQCHLGLIAVEEPPPDTEEAFRAQQGARNTLRFTTFS